MTFTVTTTADGVPETGESVHIGWEKLPGDVTAGPPEHTIVHVTDTTPPAVQVSVGDTIVAKGDAATFAVSLSQAVPTDGRHRDPEYRTTRRRTITRLRVTTIIDDRAVTT